MKDVAKYSDSKLVSETTRLREEEKEILYSLLLHIGEIDERKLYRDEGYSSLFTYLNLELGYSKGASYRRIEAARLLRKHPELYEKLTSGELSFTALVELAKCKENLSEVVAMSVGKSAEAVSKIVERETAPVTQKRKKDRVRVTKCAPKPEVDPLFSNAEEQTEEAREVRSEPLFEIAFQADEDFMQLYQEAKAVAGGRSMEEVFKKVLHDYTKRNSPKERMKRREQRKAQASKKTTGRYVSAQSKDAVYVRDGGQCTYVSPGGRRCSCKEHLEFDHVQPFGLGGESEPSNLRLLCKAHNQMMAERVYGREFMEKKRRTKLPPWGYGALAQ